MTEERDDVLSGRIDGLARVLMALIADLEIRAQFDGARFCAGLEQTAAAQRKAGVQGIAASTIADIAHQLDAAREVRRRSAGRA